jgi:hypothetical protein
MVGERTVDGMPALTLEGEALGGIEDATLPTGERERVSIELRTARAQL